MSADPLTVAAGAVATNGGPLAGVRVLELCQYIAGPYAAVMLADLGAEVVKIESPRGGDPFRGWQSSRHPYSTQFAAYNRNKRGVAIDLRTPSGASLLRRLVARADVLVENFRPGTMEDLGLGYESLAEMNSALVYVAITGFGPTGPYATRPSYDSVNSALSGLYSLLLDPDQPKLAGPAFSDVVAGLFGAQAALAALVRARSTGVGQRVDTSMVGAMLTFLAEPATLFLDAGIVSAPTDRIRRAQIYAARSSDGRSFVIHLSLAKKFWLALTDALGRRDLRTDPRFDSHERRVANYDCLDALLKTAIAERPAVYWFDHLTAHDIPHSPINTLAEVFADPHVQYLDLVRTVSGSAGEHRLLRPPTDFGVSGQRALSGPPLLGEHTDAVLSALGLSPGELADLHKQGVLG
ncbi:MAG: CaiB/BaiF CoA transferase family protein [Streptosporangiaceae bacterium]